MEDGNVLITFSRMRSMKQIDSQRFRRRQALQYGICIAAAEKARKTIKCVNKRKITRLHCQK